MKCKSKWIKFGAVAMVLGILAAGCGKTVELGAVGAQSGFLPPGASQCGPGQQVDWKFAQPDASVRRVLDALFVLDTSASMNPKRARIADRIPAFISRLDPSTDYRISVMLAHGGASYYSGRLYSAPGSQLVLDSTQLSTQAIQAQLQSTLAHVQVDVDEANGEAGMFSVMRSLDSDRLSKIQAAGFYRPEAALSVVFVTDENDICYPPELNGYTVFPDLVPSLGGIEKVAFAKYCTKPGQTASNFPDIVYSRLATFKTGQPLTLAGIVHVDPVLVPQGPSLEDSIGHGILELTRKSANGVRIDIASPDYSSGLSQLGSVVQSSLSLETRFGLPGTQALLPNSLFVTVDGKPVASLYDATSRSVEIEIGDAGKARSVVDISACLATSERAG